MTESGNTVAKGKFELDLEEQVRWRTLEMRRVVIWVKAPKGRWGVQV